MRSTLLSAVPLLAALTALPAGAQVSARIHLDVPLGRPYAPVYREPIAPIVVYDYSPYYDGDWESSYYDWAPVTLYLYDGRYYDRPFRDARPVLLYRYHDRYFSAPRDQRFFSWQRDHVRGPVRDFRDVRGRVGPVAPRVDDRRGGQVAPRRDDRGRGGQVDPRSSNGRGRGAGAGSSNGRSRPRP